MKRKVLIGAVTIIILFIWWSQKTRYGDLDVKRGIDLYAEGKYVEAIPLLEGALNKPLRVYKTYDVYNFIGGCYFDLGMLEEGVQAYTKSLEEKYDQHNIWVNKGVALRQMDRIEEAEACYQQALEIKPDYAELHSSLGSLYIIKGRPQKAVMHFDRAIELDPSLATAHGNYAMALAMLGDYSRADIELRKAARLGYAEDSVLYMRERINAMRENLVDPNNAEIYCLESEIADSNSPASP
ncbi:MAG: tetratricopeptide repeat protein [Sedimentisphaerales bacterium]|nr:tetratricopeptide repeat protein [Sedimentisphaerales bacterium]